MEVDDKTYTHRLYRDVVGGGWAYGSQRWLITLQRMCDRLTILSHEIITTDFGGAGTY